MQLVQVQECDRERMFKEFEEKSMFTFEGINIDDEDGMEEVSRILKKFGYQHGDFLMYWFLGDDMNKHYHLTGSNAYPKNFRFVVIPNFYNAKVKLVSGARWFDDIVANNTIKQHAVWYGHEPDYR